MQDYQLLEKPAHQNRGRIAEYGQPRALFNLFDKGQKALPKISYIVPSSYRCLAVAGIRQAPKDREIGIPFWPSRGRVHSRSLKQEAERWNE